MRVSKNNSEWEWLPKENEPIIHNFVGGHGVSEEIRMKYQNEPPSELSIFLEYTNPLFETIAREMNDLKFITLNHTFEDHNW